MSTLQAVHNCVRPVEVLLCDEELSARVSLDPKLRDFLLVSQLRGVLVVDPGKSGDRNSTGQASLKH